jgi:hypothetical protein
MDPGMTLGFTVISCRITWPCNEILRSNPGELIFYLSVGAVSV